MRFYAFPHENHVHKVKFSPNSQSLATFIGGITTGNNRDTEEGLLQIWDANHGSSRNLKIKGYITDFSFDHNGDRLVTAEGARDDPKSLRFDPFQAEEAKSLGFFGARVWDVTSGIELVRLPHTEPVAFAEFSPDAKLIATWSYFGPVRLWDSTTGELKKTIAKPDENDGNDHIVLSPNWAYLATITYQHPHDVKIWDVKTGDKKTTLLHQNRVNSFFFGPYSEYLSIESNSKVWIWDWRQDMLLAQINTGDNVYHLQFTPDGSQVVSASGKTVRFWHWRANDLITEACSRLEQNFKPEERRRYLRDQSDKDEPACPELPVPQK